MIPLIKKKCLSVLECSDDEFRCQFGGECISKFYLCDGVMDCYKGEDEDREKCAISVNSNGWNSNSNLVKCLQIQDQSGGRQLNSRSVEGRATEENQSGISDGRNDPKKLCITNFVVRLNNVISLPQNLPIIFFLLLKKLIFWNKFHKITRIIKFLKAYRVFDKEIS